jgi:hypothetical protein
MLVGGLLVAVGAVLYFVRGWSWLPGDIVVERKGFTLVFPIVTCVVISVLLTLLARFLGR